VEFNNTRERERERKRSLLCLAKFKTFFSLNRHNRNESIFHFSFLLPFFFSHLIERYTQANKNQNIVKRSDGDIRTIEIVLILALFHSIARSISYTNIAQWHSYASRQAY
jgi:hypothetical protein